MDIPAEFTYDLARFISFRDREACERVRRITPGRAGESPQSRLPDPDRRRAGAFYRAFADDIVGRIRAALDEGRQFVAILPVGPMPQYELAARTINEERLSLAHVHTFNMDEYASEDGVTAPVSWPGLFQRAMLDRFFGLVDPELRPPESQIHFPTSETIADYSAGSRISEGQTSATGASAGAGTSPSGSPTSGRSSTATSRRTSGPGRGSSSSTR